MWETKEGDLIPYKKLKTSHLINIINLISRKAKSGILCMTGGGWDAEDMWYDEWVEKGKEVYQRFDYWNLLKELHNRGIQKWMIV